MSVQVLYKNNVKSSVSGTVVVFVDDKYKIRSSDSLISKDEVLYLNKLLKNRKNNKSKLFTININEKKSALVILSGKNNAINDFEKLGGDCFEFLEKNSLKSILINNTSILFNNATQLLNHFLHGLKLKSYKFQIYKSKKNIKSIQITVVGKHDNNSSKKLNALEQGIFLT